MRVALTYSAIGGVFPGKTDEKHRIWIRSGTFWYFVEQSHTSTTRNNLQRLTMIRSLLLALLTCLIVNFAARQADAERGARFAARRGPWIVYRYPLFREGNRPPEARRYSQDYYWPADANERYPKFYGGFHSRFFDEIGRPSGDIGLRGYAW